MLSFYLLMFKNIMQIVAELDPVASSVSAVSIVSPSSDVKGDQPVSSQLHGKYPLQLESSDKLVEKEKNTAESVEEILRLLITGLEVLFTSRNAVFPEEVSKDTVGSIVNILNDWLSSGVIEVGKVINGTVQPLPEKAQFQSCADTIANNNVHILEADLALANELLVEEKQAYILLKDKWDSLLLKIKSAGSKLLEECCNTEMTAEAIVESWIFLKNELCERLSKLEVTSKVTCENFESFWQKQLDQIKSEFLQLSKPFEPENVCKTCRFSINSVVRNAEIDKLFFKVQIIDDIFLGVNHSIKINSNNCSERKSTAYLTLECSLSFDLTYPYFRETARRKCAIEGINHELRNQRSKRRKYGATAISFKSKLFCSQDF